MRHDRNNHHDNKPANKTDAGNGSYGISRIIDASRSPSPDPGRAALLAHTEMKPEKVNLRDIAVRHQQWGDGRYDRGRKHVSEALTGTVPIGDPFDVEVTTFAPHCFNCPQHTHTKNAEFFIILSGRGIAYRDDRQFDIGAGDYFMQYPRTSHHIYNSSETDELTLAKKICISRVQMT